MSLSINMKCNCGREGKYGTPNSDVMSCNKHVVCEPYDVIEDELRQVNMKYHSLIKLVQDLIIFREGTIEYKEAEQQINSLIKEYNKGVQ